jgi:NodT family efflux transporter outer membrane factor (OMF) lipoprotein
MRNPLAPVLVSMAGAALLAQAGCAVGPDFHRPAPPDAQAYTPETLPKATASSADPAGAAQSLTVGADIPGQWWTLFHSPAINDLVARVIRSNPDLAAAQAALRSAQETYKAQRGSLLPEVDGGYNVSREKASDYLSPPLNSSTELFTLHTAQVTVSYVPDVFGGVRRQVENAKALAEAQRFETRAVYLTLTASVVQAAIQQASLRAQLEAAQKVSDSATQVLKTMRGQFDQGQIAGADVAAQEYVAAQAAQALPPLEKQLAQQNDLLAALTGRAPDQKLDALSLSDLTLPLDLPVSLPAKLVEQRPDIGAAEANLHAASAAVGVAIAARLPNFGITGQAGGASNTFASLLSNGNSFWTLTGAVSQPIFQGGALLHKQRSAEAALDQAKAQYRSAVLAGLQNVADALQALQADSRALQAAVAAEQSASKSLAITKAQLQLGQVSGMGVLISEQAYQQALSALVQARANRFSDTVALLQSLGGGWWNREGGA